MVSAIHSEERFEDEVCGDLKAAGWLFNGPLPYKRSFVYDTGYDAKNALFPQDALDWVKETQPDSWTKFSKNHTKNPEEVFIRRLVEELDKERPTIKKDAPSLWGSLYVLRKGFKDINAHFKMAQFAPSNKQNSTTLEHYTKNRLRLVRQVHYSIHNRKCIDLVLFLNGIPLATIELKTDTTQNIHDAISQYKTDRQPIDGPSKMPEPLLQFGKRALVHFAVSTDEVHMTTKLAGSATRFLPFNRGIPDEFGGAGAGNPPDPELGYSTGYLWHQVFQPDNFLNIIGKFLAVDVSEKKDAKGRTEFFPNILFPRYHQWSAVGALVNATLEDTVGESYLIQHSAGSGKSNTIAWLAHRLASLHDAQDEKVFSSVIVITDRRVLDTQLQDTIYQFDHQQGVVEKIDENSQQLADALNNQKLIIITTLQKFPWILNKVEGLKDKRFALILDEAHSSQAGKGAIKLREVLSKGDKTTGGEAIISDENPDEEVTEEDLINKLIEARKRPPNVSYYAFTATPKPKTLELFGTEGADGIPKPFHVYSMRQAIEEEFILDVLKGYTTYEFAFKLESKEKEDRDVKSGKAKKKLFRFAQIHPTSIAQKVAVIVEHFREHVMHLLDNQAKAMVVADGRIAAVRYKKALDEYIKKMGYTDCKALVAFSGDVTDPESDVVKATEGDLNDKGECDDEIKEAFKTNAYQLLIVASKFQTGFDQPKLCAMYVDKRLDNVLAVQTLSRLNRTFPGKRTTVVIDFRNKPEDILKSFQPFYRTATLSDVTDRNLVHTLSAKLDEAGYYLDSEIEAFSKAYFRPNGQQKDIQVLLKTAFERFKKATKEQQDLFRADMSSFVTAYDFLTQLVSYDDIDLEKRHAFYSRLLPRLTGQTGIDEPVEKSIQLTAYKLLNEKGHTLKLEEGTAKPMNPMKPGGGAVWDDPEERLSAVIKKMNEVFAGNLDETDYRGYLDTLLAKLLDDPLLIEQAKANDDVDAFLSGAYIEKFNRAVVAALQSHNVMADQVLQDQKVFDRMARILAEELHLRLRSELKDQ
ncbi:type I restriction endonuclease subunit R [Limnobacter sp. MED105]|uniref:type I restriction endonuclease subunit R n=1 Tax=Limnobacter sp. MED105 TaxID=391597 RepID=UPI000156C259|nr:type I restriction endonuclease [Limnobacter sp. MED105]EDM82798.1 DEAD/DEAH box helicase-like protein [Limnobacter sp. MED105]